MSTSAETFSFMLMAGGGVLVALIGVCCKFATKMKCEDVSLCWGLFTMHRNIAAEQAADTDSNDSIPGLLRGLHRGRSTTTP